MFRSFALVSLFAFATSGWANTKVITSNAQAWPWDVSEVQLQQVEDSLTFESLSMNDCAGTSDTFDPLFFDGVTWDQIVSVGKKVWEIVKAGKPVSHAQTPVVHALPAGLQCWTDLEHWQAPRTQTYEVVYKNGFGMEVVKFRFRLHYTYGGGKAEKGQYLANVSVLPAELNVMWGYTFNASVEVGNTVNLGSRENPVAGIEMNLKWNVNTVLKDSQNSFHFFVQGDGLSRTAE